MPKLINISTHPTFDLTDWEIVEFEPEDRIIFCKSSQIFGFDKCKGSIMPRSRILRPDKSESKLVKNVISAVIDAGFTGQLMFKIELTNYGAKQLATLARADFQAQIANSIQLDLMHFAVNYYGAQNSNFQSDLNADIIFTNQNSSSDPKLV